MTRSRLTSLRTLLALLLTLAATACGGLLKSDRPVDRTWWLEPLEPQSAAATPAPPLNVELSVVPGLDSRRILTLSPEGQLSHYAGASWPDNLPEFLGSLTVRSLEASGRFERVALARAGGAEACRLFLEARKFYSRLDADQQTRSVEIELAGHLDCDGESHPVDAEASVPVSGNHMPTVIAAYQQGFNRTMAALLQQVAPKE